MLSFYYVQLSQIIFVLKPLKNHCISFKNVAEYSVLPLASSEPLDPFGVPSSSKSDSPEPPEPIASLKNPENDSTDVDMFRAPNLGNTL